MPLTLLVLAAGKDSRFDGLKQIDGQERVKVWRTPDAWFGVTYREDWDRVKESIRRLVFQGDYPQKL
jgi:hypothetical protein